MAFMGYFFNHQTIGRNRGQKQMPYMTKAERTYNAVQEARNKLKSMTLTRQGERQVKAIERNDIASLRASWVNQVRQIVRQ